jgi:hypothetical protein
MYGADKVNILAATDPNPTDTVRTAVGFNSAV